MCNCFNLFSHLILFFCREIFLDPGGQVSPFNLLSFRFASNFAWNGQKGVARFLVFSFFCFCKFSFYSSFVRFVSFLCVLFFWPYFLLYRFCSMDVFHTLKKITENDKCIALRLSWVIINFFFFSYEHLYIQRYNIVMVKSGIIIVTVL